MARDMDGDGVGKSREDKGSEIKARENEAGSDADLQARLEKLSHRLDTRRDELSDEERRKAEAADKSLSAATNLGFQALIEFVTAVVVSPLIGWQIDSWLSTKPVFFIIFLFLGMAAGLLNVYRMAVRPPGRRGQD